MDEFKFVLRCFGFAAILLVLTQIKAGETTIEGHIQASLVSSKVSNFVNKAAEGGVKLIKDGSNYVGETYREWKRSESSQPEKASRKTVPVASKLEPEVPKTAKAIAELNTEEDDTELIVYE